MSNSTLTSQLSHVNSHVLEPRILGRSGWGSTGDKLSRRTVKWKREICCILCVVYVDANLLFWTIPLWNACWWKPERRICIRIRNGSILANFEQFLTIYNYHVAACKYQIPSFFMSSPHTHIYFEKRFKVSMTYYDSIFNASTYICSLY